MTTPEQYRGKPESEITEDEQRRSDELDVTADAARTAGVFDPSESEIKIKKEG